MNYNDLILNYLKSKKHKNKKVYNNLKSRIQIFLNWMIENNFSLIDISYDRIVLFEKESYDRGIVPRYVDHIKSSLFNFFSWLNNSEKYNININQVFKHMVKKKPNSVCKLPEMALNFLDYLTVSLKPGTVSNYRSSLHFFYYIFYKKKIKNLNSINRKFITFYLIKNNDLSVSSKNKKIYHIRSYFRWLYDNDKINNKLDDLFKESDFCKKPKLLPRPLPINLDLEIQNRLNKFSNVEHLALLLMRKTGIRVGELCNLSIDCVREHGNGSFTLKIPLGKLNSERVIPIDEEILTLIKRIKIFCDQYQPRRDFLIIDKYGSRLNLSILNIFLRSVSFDLIDSKKITTHRLRHTFATSMINAGLNIVTLKNLLGHKDITMTLRYAEMNSVTIRENYFSALNKIRANHQMLISKEINPEEENTSLGKLLQEFSILFKTKVKDSNSYSPKEVNKISRYLKNMCDLILKN